MKIAYLAAAIALAASPVYAQQSSTSPGSTSNNPGAMGSKTQDQASMAKKIKSDLESAGFKDVKVVAESFAVTAKSKDGNPVYMTFGPESMSVMETVGSIPNKNSNSQSPSQSNQK